MCTSYLQAVRDFDVVAYGSCEPMSVILLTIILDELTGFKYNISE